MHAPEMGRLSIRRAGSSIIGRCLPMSSRFVFEICTEAQGCEIASPDVLVWREKQYWVALRIFSSEQAKTTRRCAAYDKPPLQFEGGSLDTQHAIPCLTRLVAWPQLLVLSVHGYGSSLLEDS